MNFWKDPIQVAADWLMSLFTGWGMAEGLANVFINLLGIVILVTIMLVIDIFWSGSSARSSPASRTGWGQTAWVRLA